MAIARGAGTEILRAHHFDIMDATNQILIMGVQHHIYTVLSVIWYAQSVQADGNWITMFLNGYDSKAGATNTSHYLMQQDMSLDQSYVWNDKFSFNGYESANFSGPLDDATKQDAIADQGSGVTQRLYGRSEHADDHFTINCTFIDQNNA